MTNPQSLNTQLANAVASIATQQDYLVQVRALTDQARSREISALNKVNDAQKHFDELVAMVKESAPKDTDWKRPVGLPDNAEMTGAVRVDCPVIGL